MEAYSTNILNEESEMAEKHLRKGLTSLVIREVQVKTNLTFYFILVRRIKIN